MADFPENVRLTPDGTGVIILDQTQLPTRRVFLTLNTPEEMYEAIHALRVRGAPAIGVCAGMCLSALAHQRPDMERPAFDTWLREQADYLASSRPTAVNLSWALRRMTALLELPLPLPELLDRLEEEAMAIQREDIDMCENISRYGLSLLHPGDGVLTHCNAGPLATSCYGTGQGPLHLAAREGFPLKIFADETRPLLQGARLTAYELQQAGADVTLICDNMASLVMKNGWVQACFVGCDRIAANGDFANKIGTSGVAILAKYYGIPVYTLGPTSTIDMSCPDGAHIPIELRDGDEIKSLWYEKPMALPEVKCFNPSFDVTDHSLLTGIVTEKGICYPPFTESLAALFKTK